MKRTILIAAITLVIFITVFYSCTKKGQESTVTPPATEKESPVTTARLAQTTTTIKLTKEILDLGVTQIDLLSNTGSEYVFRLNANPLNFNGLDSFSLDKKTVKLILDRAFIIMEYESGKRLRYHTGKKQVFFDVDGQQVPLSDWSSENIVLSKEEEDLLIWGLVVLNEFVNNTAIRYTGGLQRAKHGIWVTYNGASSRTMALHKTELEAARFLRNNPNCSIVGGYDSSCVWDNHLCIASVHYSCD